MPAAGRWCSRPEFTSNPRKGHPLFTAYVKAALARKAAQAEGVRNETV